MSNSTSNLENENENKKSENSENTNQTDQSDQTEINEEESIEEKLSKMTLYEKIGQLFIVRPDSLDVTTVTKSNTRKYFKKISCWRNCSI